MIHRHNSENGDYITPSELSWLCVILPFNPRISRRDIRDTKGVWLCVKSKGTRIRYWTLRALAMQLRLIEPCKHLFGSPVVQDLYDFTHPAHAACLRARAKIEEGIA